MRLVELSYFLGKWLIHTALIRIRFQFNIK